MGEGASACPEETFLNNPGGGGGLCEQCNLNLASPLQQKECGCDAFEGQWAVNQADSQHHSALDERLCDLFISEL